MAIDDSTTLVSDFSRVMERSYSSNEDKILRVPFYLTSSYRKKLKVKGVSMMVNPTTVSFSQSKRITRKDTQSGAVFFHWANRAGRNNDILDINFSGQTGNINIKTGTGEKGILGSFGKKFEENGPMGWLNNQSDLTTKTDSTNVSVLLQGTDYARSGASKLSSFWNLYSLSREPVVDPRTGAPVYYYISYNSPILGNTFITFIGHFNNVLEFSEDANSPNTINYSFGFTALASTPSMDYLYPTLVNNLRSVFMNPLG